MTTHTLTGGVIVRDAMTQDILEVRENPDITLEIVVPETTTTFSYSSSPSGPLDPPGSVADIDVEAYNIRLEGVQVPTSPGMTHTMSVFSVNWAGPGPASGSAVVLSVYVDYVIYPPTAQFVDLLYVFRLGGDMWPSLAGLGWPGGTAPASGIFVPDTDIALTSLAATVSEDDFIVGETMVSNVLNGGIGNDTIHGNNMADVLNGGSGNDVLVGGGGSDTMRGLGGRDVLDSYTNGYEANDTMYGGAGNDVLLSGWKDNKLYGGSGRDRADYSAVDHEGVVVDLKVQSRNSGAAEGDVLSSIEDVTGTDFNDTLSGYATDNRLIGRDGNDRLFGRGGNDALYAGAGQDRLVGGSGDDVLRGQGGRDTFVFHSGHDIIEDYRDNETLCFDDALWGGTLLTAAQVLDFADVVGNSVVFDFGGSNTLTLEKYVDLAGLVDDIEIF